jgi:FixJ family two-component response regulator
MRSGKDDSSERTGLPKPALSAEIIVLKFSGRKHVRRYQVTRGGGVEALATRRVVGKADPNLPPGQEKTRLSVSEPRSPPSSVFVVDGDKNLRQAARGILEHIGYRVEDYRDGREFLDAYRPGRHGCLLLDANLAGISGLHVLRHLRKMGDPLPAIMMTAKCDAAIAVEAMKAGVLDFLEKPFCGASLLAGVRHAVELSRASGRLMKCRNHPGDLLDALTR